MHTSKAEFFNSQVEAYWASVEYSPDKLAKIARMMKIARISCGMKVLEPGCGTGRLTRILADTVGSGGRILAVDISERMVETCLRNTDGKANVEVVLASVEDYPFSPREFDAIVCHQVFPHFDDKLRALTIFAAILKPYGKLVIFHFINSSEINEMHRTTHDAVMEDSMPSEATMKSMFRSSGFRIDLLEDDEDGYLLISRLAN